MRKKYRSAIYTYSEEQYKEVRELLTQLQNDFDEPIITQILPFHSFKANRDELLNYFYQSPNRPFCQTYIHPKLKVLLTRYKSHVDSEKLAEMYNYLPQERQTE